MKGMAKQFGLLGLALSTFSLNSLFGSAAQAQEGTAVIEINYDDKQPTYDFGYCYGGYKLKGPDSVVSFNEKLSKKARTITEGGNEGGAFEASLDISKVDIPKRKYVDFVYIGLGAGVNGDIVNCDFSKFDVADFKVVFDAKIENGKPMSNSRIELYFVTTDGQGPKPDNDTEDDMLCVLNYAGSESVNEIKLTNVFQTIEVELSKMQVGSGSIEQIRNFQTRGVSLVVVAEGTPDHFGIGGETKLIVDNYRLIQKQKPSSETQ